MQSEPAHELLYVGEVLGTTEAFSACACTLSEPHSKQGGDEFDWCQILFLHQAFHSNTHKWLQCHWNRTTLVVDSGN